MFQCCKQLKDIYFKIWKNKTEPTATLSTVSRATSVWSLPLRLQLPPPVRWGTLCIACEMKTGAEKSTKHSLLLMLVAERIILFWFSWFFYVIWVSQHFLIQLLFSTRIMNSAADIVSNKETLASVPCDWASRTWAAVIITTNDAVLLRPTSNKYIPVLCVMLEMAKTAQNTKKQMYKRRNENKANVILFWPLLVIS